MNKSLNTQICGNHYLNMAMQPIEFCFKNNLNICQSNIIKYIVRYRQKDGIRDLKKARHMIDILIEFEYGDQKSTGQPNQIETSPEVFETITTHTSDTK